MSLNLHADAQPIIDAFIANGAKSLEQMGELSELRHIYETNCGLAAMQGLQHIESLDVSVVVDGLPVGLRLYDKAIETVQHRPTVVFIHGGGWVIGNLNTHDSICRKIADVAEVRVIAIDYRLAPEHPFPVPYQDCQRALTYIMQENESLKVDTTRLVFCGDSAGANIAAHLGQNFYQNYLQPLKAQVLLYPVIGCFTQSKSYQDYQAGLPLVNSTMHWFFNQLTQDPQQRDALSLLEQAFDPRNGDIYLLTVQHDPLRDEALKYLEKAIQNGLNVEYHHLNGLMHGIFTLAGKLAIAEQYLEHIGKYIAAKI